MKQNMIILGLVLVVGIAAYLGFLFLSRQIRNTATAPATRGGVVPLPDVLSALSGKGSGTAGNVPQNFPTPGTPASETVVETAILPTPVLAAPTNPGGQKQISRAGPTPSSGLNISHEQVPTRAPPGKTTPRKNVASPQSFLEPLLPIAQEIKPVAPEQVPSALTVFPNLASMRQEMIANGFLKNTEFVAIKNNTQLEAFVLKIIEWKGKQASSSPEVIGKAKKQVQDMYDRLATGGIPAFFAVPIK